MSHTLHRQGKRRDLAGDWIVLAMSARGINRRGSASRLRRFLKMSLKHHPVNFGDMRTGNCFTKNPREILSRIGEDSLLNIVFDSEEALLRFLEELRSASFGLSVVVSGLLDRGCRCVRDAGLAPHTFALSLGIWGRTDKLPDRRMLEITTMCGHGLVSSGYVRLMEGKVAAGEMTALEAAAELSRPCVCGVFNPVRAAKLLRKKSSRRHLKAVVRPRGLRGGGGSSPSRSKRGGGARS